LPPFSAINHGLNGVSFILWECITCKNRGK
jgi:hypothetical protein